LQIDLHKGDCLELMKDIPDGSVDLVLTDPPYGTMKGIEKSRASKDCGYRACDWDEVIPTDKMFAELSRALRPKRQSCFVFARTIYIKAYYICYSVFALFAIARFGIKTYGRKCTS
jgi:DNA modification methylase